MLERSRFAGAVRLLRNGYLNTTGWLKSVNRGESVDAQNEPIPWMTYPAIFFLERRLNESMRVFEYGAGNSTLWWANRVAAVESCEHDSVWAERIRQKVPSNVTLRVVKLDPPGEYANAILSSGGQFDIVVNDGRDRINCARASLNALTGNGVIIWDNSDRDEYSAGYDFLLGQGFRQVDFYGLGPINAMAWQTSIFYRSKNCLGL